MTSGECSTDDAPMLDRSMLVGVPLIDEQHRLLVAQLNRLHDDTLADPHSATFVDVLGQLGDALAAHFKSEESFFQACGMPAGQVTDHLRAHDEILKQYCDLNLALMNRHPMSRHSALGILRGWIIDHVKAHDLKIRDHMAASPAG
jgi:hemerythrin-like metal-binding protein